MTQIERAGPQGEDESAGHAAAPGRHGGQHARDMFFSFLLDKGLLGLAWADDELIISDTAGPLASWITVGAHVPTDLPPFLGLEDDLHALMDDLRPSLVIANVGLASVDPNAGKISLEVFWFEPLGQFAIILHRLGGQPDFEADLARQLRARRLAEENLGTVQREVREAKQLLDVIASRSTVGLAVLGKDGVRRFATRRWLQALGTTGGTDTGAMPGGHVAGGTDTGFADGLSQSMRGHETSGRSPANRPGRPTDGQTGQVWSHRPWFDASGDIGGVVSAFHDDTGLIVENERLRQRLAQSERINQDLEAFAAMIAHDIRGPAAAARVQLVALSAGDDECPSKTVPRIDVALARICQIADGLLEFASVGGQSGPAHAVNLEALVNRIGADCVAGTRMRIATAGAWPLVTTAVAPLDITLRNLIQNAVRHHDTGFGTVTVSVVPAPSELVISVADDGPGIPGERHVDIFAPATSFAGEGTPSSGLGLAFVKRAVESVGGRINVESDPARRRGTTFHVNWPIHGASR